MPICVFCSKKNHIDLKCKWCELSVCVKCIQPEFHLCTGIKECIHHKSNILKINLMNQRVSSVKVKHI
jgi:hypothetical protein